MKRYAVLCLLMAMLASCGSASTPTPDAVATQIAVEKAAYATMTAEAPAATNTATVTNTPTDTPIPTPTLTPTDTDTPTPTWTPTATWTPTPSPTPTDTPTETPTATTTPKPTGKPKPKSTKKPQTKGMLLFASTELSEDDLFTIDEQGGNRKRLTTIGKIGRAVYSPDGQRIAFQRTEGGEPYYQRDIYIMSADGSGLTNITQSIDWTEFEPDWSPDGTKIAFRGRPVIEEYSKVYIMNADGTGRTLLIDINNSNRFPTWSPDGSRIVFVSYWEGGGGKWKDKGDIYSISIDGTQLRNLTNRGESFTSPIWSPDGREIIYSRLTRDPSLGEYWQIWRMNANGGNQHCIIGCKGDPSKYSNVAHAWRGSRIAFSSWKDGNWDIFLANDDGTNIVRLTNESFDEKCRDWKP